MPQTHGGAWSTGGSCTTCSIETPGLAVRSHRASTSSGHYSRASPAIPTSAIFNWMFRSTWIVHNGFRTSTASAVIVNRAEVPTVMMLLFDDESGVEMVFRREFRRSVPLGLHRVGFNRHCSISASGLAPNRLLPLCRSHSRRVHNQAALETDCRRYRRGCPPEQKNVLAGQQTPWCCSAPLHPSPWRLHIGVHLEGCQNIV